MTHDRRDGERTEEPLWARAEAEAATFAPRRIAPPRRAPLLVALMGVVAIGSLIGLGSLADREPGAVGSARGTSEIGQTTAPTAAPATAALVAVRPPAVGRVEGGSGAAPVSLTTPAAHSGPVHGRSVVIDGQLEVRASSIRVALQLDRFQRLDAVVIDTTDPNGGLRPDRTLTFHVELALPSPRPAGQVWIVITAFDRSGDPLGTLRQAIMIGDPLPNA